MTAMTRPTPPWYTEARRDGGDPFRHRNDTSTASADGRDPRAAGPSSAQADERRHAEIRRRAIDRLVMMSVLQAEDAWGRRRRDPVEPHALAFLYIQPDGRGPYWCRLTAASRRWLRDEHAFTVHDRIFRFYDDLVKMLPRQGFDVRELADLADPEMFDDATFVGLGVCSLDTSTGSWQDVVATAVVETTDTRSVRLWGRADTTNRPAPKPRQMPVESPRDIPAAIRIMLTDGTVIVGERRGRPDFDHKILHSTHTLDFGPGETPYPWGWVTREQLEDDPAHAEVLRWMGQLTDLCAQTDAARLDAMRRRPAPRRADG